jgi:hypothetical protein
MKQQTMKQTWFRNVGWIYLPIHFMGMVITLAAIVFLVTVCIAVFKDGNSVGDELYKIFIYSTCTAFWWKWIADKTSK